MIDLKIYLKYLRIRVEKRKRCIRNGVFRMKNLRQIEY